MLFYFLGAQQALIDYGLNRLRVDVQFLGRSAGEPMEIILGGISTRPPPVLSDDLVGKVPDEIDLTCKGLEATFLVAILKSVSKGQYHTFLWLQRQETPVGECMSIPKWELKTGALISPPKLGSVLMQESQVMDGVLRARPIKLKKIYSLKCMNTNTSKNPRKTSKIYRSSGAPCSRSRCTCQASVTFPF